MKKTISIIILVCGCIFTISNISAAEGFFGSLVDKIISIFNPQSQPQNYLAAGGTNGINFTYDTLDRVTKVEKTDGGVVTYTHNASENSVTMTNENGGNTKFQFQSFGDDEDKRLASFENVGVGNTSYSYDVYGNITSVRVGSNLLYSYTYNSKGFLTASSTPEGGSVAYTHDNVGNVKSKTDGLGVTSYQYDEIDRVILIDYPGTESDTLYEYYPEWDGIKLISTPTITYNLGYDDDGKITSKAYNVGGANKTILVGYNQMGKVNSLRYPNNKEVLYEYYDDGIRVSRVLYDSRVIATNILYSYNGKISEMMFGNRTKTTNEYDSRGRPSRLKITDGYIGTTQASMDYSWDPRNNLLARTDTAFSTRNINNTWDSLDRLSASTGHWGTVNYSYDYSGGRTSETLGGVTKTYNRSNGRLTGITAPGFSKGYSYNPVGGVTQAGDVLLTYNGFGRTASIEKGSEKTTYRYDGSGNRIEKNIYKNTSLETSTLYHLDPFDNIISEETAGTIIDYIYLEGSMIAKYEN